MPSLEQVFSDIEECRELSRIQNKKLADDNHKRIIGNIKFEFEQTRDKVKKTHQPGATSSNRGLTSGYIT